ncbi:MAG: FAD-dependent oxidoreductase [Clostridiales bacterium]|nr:FAD-dependent oxidoreductase [Clostridiales bacterium]MDE6201090.1 FAD-dependent oxidoreductase [Clostridiales bacterium]
MYDFIIIGGGTAGLSSAVYACRANKSTLVIEREAFGGQIVDAPMVENYPGIVSISGAQFASDLFDQAEKAGATFKCETVQQIIPEENSTTVVTDCGKYQAKAIIIAAGCEHKRLGVQGEDRLIGSGVSYCALCDGAFFKDKTVAVVGGGNAAFSAAMYLAGVASLVYIIHRRDAFRAEPAVVERAKALNSIRFVTNAKVTELIGDDELTALKLDVGGAPQQLDVDGLFVSIGQQPDNGVFAPVALDESGYIIADNMCRTNIKGIYAAGDCRAKTVRQLTTAAADGAIAVQTALGEVF